MLTEQGRRRRRPKHRVDRSTQNSINGRKRLRLARSCGCQWFHKAVAVQAKGQHEAMLRSPGGLLWMDRGKTGHCVAAVMKYTVARGASLVARYRSNYSGTRSEPNLPLQS